MRVPASRSAAFLELFPTPARTWIVPPDLVLADAHRRRFPSHHSGDVRQLTERQPFGSKVDLSLHTATSCGIPEAPNCTSHYLLARVPVDPQRGKARCPPRAINVRSFGNTSRCSASRSTFRSSKVELTKTRKVRVAIGMERVPKSDDSVFDGPHVSRIFHRLTPKSNES